MFSFVMFACFFTPVVHADIIESGNLLLGSQAVIGGTVTVQGEAFSVGGSSFSVSAGTVQVSGLILPSDAGIRWADGTTSTTAVAGGGGSTDNSTFTYLTDEYTNTGTNMGPCIAGSTVTLTTSGGPVEISFDFSQAQTAGGGGTRVQVLMDGNWIDDFGASESMAPMSRESGGSSVQLFPTLLLYRTNSPPSAGSHGFCVTFERNAGGTSYITCKKSGAFAEGPKKCLFSVRELK